MDMDMIGQSLAGSLADTVKKSPVAGEDQAALKEACQGFEAIFLSTLLKTMRSTVTESGLFGQSNGMDIYRSMQDQALAEELSRGSNATGIGELFFKSLQNSVD